jgi:multidrug efflux pump subunit AcrB
MLKLPGSFLPTEDQGEIMVQYTLPAGATTVRAEVAARCANGSSQRESQYRRYLYR